MAGTLYIVATPIGNLEDITIRAINTLKDVDLIAAEDTRHTLKLLNHYNISKPLTSYFEHNKDSKGEYIIQELLQGKNVALVSDAGSPGISDPGENLIKDAIENNIKITSIPGPAAVINALILSGLSTKRFVFEGFLPKNKSTKKEILNSIKDDTRTIVFYESPHNLIKTLKNLYEVFDDRNICVAREMTKKFEEIIRCTIKDAIEKFSDTSPRGEFVIIVEGKDKSDINQNNHWDDLNVPEHIDYYLQKGFSKKESLKKVAQDRGVSKREIYMIDVKNKNKRP